MRRADEDGFALISAVWLLTLAATIAALLMLQALRQARDIVVAQEQAGAEQSMDDILARLASAMLFQGPASNWGHVPATGQVDLGHGLVGVAVERENARLDVNKAALADVDGLLHDRGFPPEQRAAILTRIGQARAAHRLIGTFADIAALGRGVVADGREECLANLLSPFGDLRADAQAGNGDVGGASPVRAGDTLRVAITEGARRKTAVIRILGTRDEPYSVLDWYDGGCPEAAAA